MPEAFIESLRLEKISKIIKSNLSWHSLQNGGENSDVPYL